MCDRNIFRPIDFFPRFRCECEHLSINRQQISKIICKNPATLPDCPKPSVRIGDVGKTANYRPLRHQSVCGTCRNPFIKLVERREFELSPSGSSPDEPPDCAAPHHPVVKEIIGFQYLCRYVMQRRPIRKGIYCQSYVDKTVFFWYFIIY